MSGRAEAAPGARLAAAPRPGDVGYAAVWTPDAGRAAAFYAAVLGWEYAAGHDPRGRMARGTAPPQGLWGGQARCTLFCSYVVADAAGAVRRVRAAGGQAEDPVRQPYGLGADCADNQGIRFAVHQPTGGAAGGRRAGRDGDLVYVTWETPDARAAREFYGAVLGWRFRAGRVADGWQVDGAEPGIGILGGQAQAVGVPVWLVSDVVAAAGRVRAAGGTAGEPSREPYGLIAGCADDQGARFSVLQPAAVPG